MAGEVTVHFIEPIANGPIVSNARDNADLANMGAVAPDHATRFAAICYPAMRLGDVVVSGEPWAASCELCVAKLHERGVSTEKPGAVRKTPLVVG